MNTSYSRLVLICLIREKKPKSSQNESFSINLLKEQKKTLKQTMNEIIFSFLTKVV